MDRLAECVVVVTGAASGIGAACVERIRAEGGSTVTVDLAGSVDHLVDVRDEAGVARVFEETVATFGRLDGVVNAAGVAGGGPVHLVEESEWDRVVDVNLKGTFLVDKHASIHMLAQGSGSIVNIASIEGLEGTEGGSSYNASKGGVVMLTKSIAIDYGRRGIRVNCICPGLIETGMTKPIFDGARARGNEDKIGQLNPLKRGGVPSEIAHAGLFLISDDSSYVNGQAVVVDGGLSSSHPVVRMRK